MQPETRVEVVRRLRALLPRGVEVPPRTTSLSVSRYLDRREHDAELRALFRRYPTVVAHASELPEPGWCVATRLGDVPLLLVRDGERARVFLNACRHRGAELLRPGAGCRRKSLVCPYHAWTYGLDGALLGVPREDTFAALDRDALGLVEVAAERRHGFLWACLEGPVDVRAHLGPALDDDLAGFGLAEHARVGSREHDVRANWKLLMDAFAEGYHVRSLHRDSLARYFLEVSLTDDLNPHVRHVGARASFRDAEVPDIRRDTTPFYNLFPNSILVLHPNSISWVTLQPEGVGRTRFVHRMLARPGDADAAALERSFAFIDEQVFAREDLATAESIQRALATGANDHVLLGAQEEGMRLFHRNRDRAIARELETSRESG